MTLPTVAILAGGFGTRLGDLARDRPKPMIEIAGKPFLAHVIDSFVERGFLNFVLLVGHRAEVIEQWFGDGRLIGASVQYSRETEPLGTGGAVREAASLLGEHFIVTYGDILRRFHYDLFAENAENRLAVYPYQSGSTSIRSGNTEVNEDGRVTRFVKDGGLRYVDAGFASVTAAALRMLPREGPCSFESTVYPQLAATGQLSAEIVDFDFFDIGNPADLARTRAALEEH